MARRSLQWFILVSMCACFLHAQQDAKSLQDASRAPQKTLAAKEPLLKDEADAATAAMGNMPGMDHSAHGQQATSGHHMHMNGDHMHMSTLRAIQPGDQDRADKLVGEVMLAMAQWKDWREAEKAGYKIFLPNIPQEEYHFTNWKFALENEFKFNPSHPTSLLYKKTGAEQYELVGAMFTAPKRFSEDRINERVPLSITQWHQHTNFCQAPKGREKEYFGKGVKFGLQGSIVTKEVCDAEGGKFLPVIYNWMVHVYPYEKSQDAIWAREHQMEGMAGMNHDH